MMRDDRLLTDFDNPLLTIGKFIYVIDGLLVIGIFHLA